MAALQEILTYCLVGLSVVVRAGIKNEVRKEEKPSGIGIFITRALVATHGETAADPHRLIELIQQAVVLRDQLKEQVPSEGTRAVFPSGPADFQPATTFEGLLSQTRQIRPEGPGAANTPPFFLKRILLAGIRSVAAYADHAFLLGHRDDQVSDLLIDHLVSIYGIEVDTDELIGRIRDCGHAVLRSMALLEDTCARVYGAPLPSTVPLGVQKGEAILVDGRNFNDLEALLEQTQDAGIRVYTYGEMLDAHQYPILKRFPHFSGHYEQMHQAPEERSSFFPGPVVLTGGSPVPDEPVVRGHLFSSGELNLPGIARISHRNFGPVIDQALAMEGFPCDEDLGNSVVGNKVDGLAQMAGRLSDKIRNRNSKNILLVAQCQSRQTTPALAQKDGVNILLKTAQKKDHIALGRTHDPGAVVRVVETLARELETDATCLPVTVGLSWQGQKTAGVMLALFSLGLKDIRLGPILPTGLSPDCFGTLEQQLGILHDPVCPGSL